MAHWAHDMVVTQPQDLMGIQPSAGSFSSIWPKKSTCPRVTSAPTWFMASSWAVQKTPTHPARFTS